ncbi:hypothetical protein HPP92_014861 [Vanilla planifolia]|uniref:Uncharacterized protein n=1 Tax=Vanilla planifolia TaxID=51239 RepID=A0A835URH8_VANPL|nr:hypothetical protein HPP92_014861 [Vanilla planifolia]
MESDFHTRSVSQDESQSIADEILARRIKNRDRQRRYRARKRLEADMQRSCLMEGRVFWTAETISNVSSSNIESHESIVQPEMQGSLIHSAYEKRVYSGRKWKKEARKVQFSTIMDNLAFGETPAEVVESVVTDYPANPNGRRDWKGDARKKMDAEARNCDRIPLGLSV